MSPRPQEAERQDAGAKTPPPQILLPLEERATHFRDMLLERGVRDPRCPPQWGGGEPATTPPRATSPSSPSCMQATCRTFRGQETRKGTSPRREQGFGGCDASRAVLAPCPQMRLCGEQVQVSQKEQSPGRSAGLCPWPSCRHPAGF